MSLSSELIGISIHVATGNFTLGHYTYSFWLVFVRTDTLDFFNRFAMANVGHTFAPERLATGMVWNYRNFQLGDPDIWLHHFEITKNSSPTFHSVFANVPRFV